MNNLNEVKLGDLAYEVSERVANPSESGYERFVGLEHLDSGSFYVNRWGSTSDVKSSMKLFKKGDILFARRNTYLKRVSVADFDGVCSGDIIVLREYESTIKGITLLIMNLEKFWDFTISNSAGTMSKRAKWRDICEFRINIYSDEYLKRIVKMFGDIENIINRKQRLLDTTNIYINKFRNNILTKGIEKKNLKKSKIGYISESMEIYKLSELCELITDGSHFSPETVSGGKPIATVENMRENSIDIESCRLISEEQFENLIRGNCRPNIGDVLLSKDGTIGKVIVYNQTDEIVLLSSIAIIRPNKDILMSDYLKYLLKSNLFDINMNRYKTGTSIKRLVLKSINNFILPIPSVDEQIKIINVLDSADAFKVDIEKSINDINILKKILLNNVFN